MGYLIFTGCESKEQLKKVFLLKKPEEFILFIKGLFSMGDYGLIREMVMRNEISFKRIPHVPELAEMLQAFHVSEERFNTLFGRVGELLYFCLSEAQRRENCMVEPLNASEAFYVLCSIEYCHNNGYAYDICDDYDDNEVYSLEWFIPVLQIRSREALEELLELYRIVDSSMCVSIDESKIHLISEIIQNHPTKHGLDYFEQKHYSPDELCYFLTYGDDY